MYPASLPSIKPNSLSALHGIEDSCNIHIDDTNPDAPKIIVEDHWYFGHMTIIDEFVQKVLGSDEPAFKHLASQSGRERWYRQAWIAPHLREVTSAITPYINEQFDVRNVCVELFLVACKELEILDWATHLTRFQGNRDWAQAIASNQLVDTVRRLAKKAPYSSRLWHFHHDWKANLTSCLDYVDGLFKDCSRYTVVRLDLGYKKEFGFDIFTREAKADMTRLVRTMGRAKYLKKECKEKQLFANLAGFVWKLEYGTDRLLHFHMYLFFTKKNGAQAGYWAQEIGRYWVDVITHGRGHFDNGNYRWAGKAKEGIGEVNRDDALKRQNLTEALRYLFKKEQRLPILKADPNFRTFGKGCL